MSDNVIRVNEIEREFYLAVQVQTSKRPAPYGIGIFILNSHLMFKGSLTWAVIDQFRGEIATEYAADKDNVVILSCIELEKD